MRLQFFESEAWNPISAQNVITHDITTCTTGEPILYKLFKSFLYLHQQVWGMTEYGDKEFSYVKVFL
jgi:hypothetical protein